MIAQVQYAPLAISHLDAIQAYIAEHSPRAAENVAVRIRASIELLRDFPLAGRRSARRGTRELKVARLPYVIVYRTEVRNGVLIIIGVYHTAQRRPGRRL